MVKVKGKKRGGTIATPKVKGGLSIGKRGKAPKTTGRGVAAAEPEPKSMYSIKATGKGKK